MDKPFQSLAKRCVDVLFAAGLLVVTAPVIVCVAVLIRLRLGSPVFFIQERLGRGGQPFRLIKFRTMKDSVDQLGEPLPDEDRLTPFGTKLRRLSLDELPQLMNVVKGDMSLVGPRPLLPEYKELYSEHQWRRHEVKPGIAGPVLAGGRNALSWPDKLSLDVWYVDNWSLWLDLKILARTARSVLKREGVSAEGHATMPRFEGTEE